MRNQKNENIEYRIKRILNKIEEKERKKENYIKPEFLSNNIKERFRYYVRY